jgi:AraC-like DNA-binding protein
MNSKFVFMNYELESSLKNCLSMFCNFLKKIVFSKKKSSFAFQLFKTMTYKFFSACFICLFFGFFNPSLAQPNEKLDYEKVKKQYIEAKDETQRLKIATQYLKNAKAQKSWDDVARGYILYQNIYNYSTSKLALTYNDSIMLIKNKLINKEDLGFYYYSRGKTLSLLKRYDESLNYHLKNINLNIKNENYYLSKFEIAIYKGAYLQQRKEALALYKECYEFFKLQKNNPEFRPYIYQHIKFNITYNNLKIGNLKYAYDNCIIGYNESITYENEFFKNLFILLQGQVHLEKNEPKTTIDSINKTLKYLKEKEIFYYETWAYNSLGKAYIKLNQPTQAVNYFKLVDSIYVKNSYIEPTLTSSYTYLIEFYKKQKNYPKQLYYTNQLLKIDSTFTQDYKLIINKLQKEYDLPQLTKDKEVLIQKLENKGTANVYIIIVLGILIFMVIGYATKTHKEKNEIKKLLNTIQEKTEAPVLKIDEISIVEEKIEEENTDERQEKELKTSETIVLSEKIIKDFTIKIEFFEKQLGYLNKKIVLNDLAKEFSTNSKYLSLYLNRYGKGIKFNEYINELRINYIVKQITKNPKMINYTIEALANEAGFNNATTFANAFKAKLDVLPSEYLEYLKKSKKAS